MIDVYQKHLCILRDNYVLLCRQHIYKYVALCSEQTAQSARFRTSLHKNILTWNFFYFSFYQKTNSTFLYRKITRISLKIVLRGSETMKNWPEFFIWSRAQEIFFPDFLNFCHFQIFFGKLKIFKTQSQLCEMKKCGLICADMIFYIDTKYK